jgi:eukaryotic-like serine/threonine-protein kinase
LRIIGANKIDYKRGRDDKPEIARSAAASMHYNGAPMALAPGTKLGPYEIQSLLGAGGMGEVYRARDTRLQRDVAIKILPQSLAHDRDRLRRFEQEARAVAALNHPNLLTVFDVGASSLAQDEGETGAPSGAAGGASESPFIVSELLEGTTLRERLASGALRERKAVDYAIQIARGLAAAHERGIIHRDLKPENLFVTNDGRVKILDFGLAKLTEAAPADSDATLASLGSVTQAGVVMGTIGYMSPEQVRGKPADPRSDIFSFGTVLYEMLAGRRAFQGDTPADLMSAILHHEPPELTATNQEISPALDHIVHHCMEKDAQQRFQSAGDIAFQLGEMSGLRSSTGAKALAETGASKKLKPWMFATIGAAALILLLAATWFLARATARTTPPKFTQLTFQQGYVESARFLPNGQGFICVSRWASDTVLGLYTGQIDSPGLRSLGIPADSLVSVSSGGELLVIQNFQAVGPGYARAGTLARLPVGGGAPRPVLDSVQYADWAPDGKDFTVVRFVPASHVYRLEYPVGKVLYETAGWISHPRFSRDGKRIAFLDHPVFGDDQGAVAVVDLEGHRKQVSSSYGSIQGVVWSPNGDEIWFNAIAAGVHRSLFAVTLGGRERSLYSVPGDVDVQDALPDGRVLLAQQSERRVLMVFTTEYPEGRDFTWMDWVYGTRFSFDGKQILFGDEHVGPMYGAFLRNLDGSPAVRLGDGNPDDLSPDGAWAASRLPVPPVQITLLPTGTGEPRQLTHSKISHTTSRWLADGRLVANGSEPGHTDRAYLIDANGNETPITPDGIRMVALSSDGKRMVTTDAASHFQLFPIGGGEPQPLSQLQKDDRPFDFTLDNAALLVRVSRHDGGFEIWRIELAGAKRTLLHTMNLPGVPAISNGFNVTASRDGKSYAYQNHPAISTEYLVEGLR